VHLSTSNFRRPIPTANWPRVWTVTGTLIVLSLIVWESHWRSQGYTPGHMDSKDYWAEQRDRVGTGDGKQTVLVGASRVRFDVNLDTWESFRGKRPIQLSMDGSAGYPYLVDLAEDDQFTGTVICGVTEEIFFMPEFTPLAQSSIVNVRHARRRGPSDRVSFEILKFLNVRLAMLRGWDLSLSALIDGALRFENRPGAVTPPYLPPLFNDDDLDRQARMWESLTADSELGLLIQRTWPPLFGFGPPHGGPFLEAVMAKVVKSVETIEARGGRVIFVRFPSTDKLREIERQRTPRAKFWDRMLAETGAPGVHFEDYPALSKYSCPEWSHLTAEDASKFTADLIRAMEAEGLLAKR
jgi:hypothetical protein